MKNVINRRQFIKSALTPAIATMGLVVLGTHRIEVASADEYAEVMDEQISYLQSLSYSELAALALAEDGYWGSGTTAALQAYMRSASTGVINHQWAPNINANPGLTSGWYCDDTLEGDPNIRIFQFRLHTTGDGIFGTNDIRALQSRMGTYVDGVLSAGSPCIREMQRRLNDGWLFD